MKMKAERQTSEAYNIPAPTTFDSYLSEVSDGQLLIPTNTTSTSNRRSESEHKQAVSQEKSQKRMAEMSRKQILLAPEPKPVQMQLTPAVEPDGKIQKITGKYSGLHRELSLAMRSTHS